MWYDFFCIYQFIDEVVKYTHSIKSMIDFQSISPSMVNVILLIFLISAGLPSVLIFLNSSIAKKIIQEREKPSAFECGFDPKRSARLPFSLRFYLIAVIFLIFDVEITLIIPIPVIAQSVSLFRLSILSVMFILILIAGLFHEWNEGALEWS
jgi:NADH-ubiquinone oxidoreductase chain 3